MLDERLLHTALNALDDCLQRDKIEFMQLLVGGGGAMIGVYNFPNVTVDIDAIITSGQSLSVIERQIYEVAQKLHLSADWINPHYGTFTLYLPMDFKKRLRPLFTGKRLSAVALGPEEILIMKFMAGRKKDLPHIRFLIKKGAELEIVEKRLQELKERFPKEGGKALELFDEITDEGES